MNIPAPRNLQAEIDAIEWYHEFDFGNGLHARSKTPDVSGHQAVWRFIENHLASIDFRNKTVLDVGCWDGYWSFYAERRGAKSILATDDCNQNWASGAGLLLAKELLRSSVTVNQNVSIYELSKLNKTFDIVLCLGVYYHLIDPIFAFTQLRSCCHPRSLVILEGEVTTSLRPDTVFWNLDGAALPVFIPTPYSLGQMLRACYLQVMSQTWRQQPHRPSWVRRWRKRLSAALLGTGHAQVSPLPQESERMLTICAPVEGENLMHPYPPPFGLHRYDPRFNKTEQ